MSGKADLDRVRIALIRIIDSIENLRQKNVSLNEGTRDEIDKNIEEMIECVDKICGIVKEDSKKERDSSPKGISLDQ